MSAENGGVHIGCLLLGGMLPIGNILFVGMLVGGVSGIGVVLLGGIGSIGGIWGMLLHNGMPGIGSMCEV